MEDKFLIETKEKLFSIFPKPESNRESKLIDDARSKFSEFWESVMKPLINDPAFKDKIIWKNNNI